MNFSTSIKRNAHLAGRFSKRKRQIHILLTENAPTGPLQTVVDTKLFRRKVDVKAVDAFAGFVDDVGAQRGVLITNGGYTRAALKRAFYGPSDLELDILNFAALDLETAKKKKEFLFINFWKKTNEPITAVELEERQVARLRRGGPVEVSHRETVQRSDALTRLRIADVKRYECLWLTSCGCDVRFAFAN